MRIFSREYRPSLIFI